MNINTGARLHGSVRHVIINGMVTACGRLVIAGLGSAHRMCKTCVRINTQARTLNDRERKAARDMRIQETLTASTEEFSTWEWSLSEEEWTLTLEKIDKINERCAKKGIPGGLKVEWTREIEEVNNFGVKIEKISYLTKITGIAPKLPGWSFIATLDYDQHAGLIVRGYPGAAPVDRTTLREGWCDHCQTNRLRHVTYVMRNDETGEQVQVGSSCIKDFTGWNALPYMSADKDVSEFSGGFGGGPKDVTVLSALAISWACVKEYGFKRSNEPGATKGMVMDVIDPPKRNKQNADYLNELARISKYSEEMYGKAEELREFILNDSQFPLSDRSDYPFNMKAIIGAKKVSFRNLGLLASAPQAWARFLEKTFIQKAAKIETPDVHIGNVKERWELTVTVETVNYKANDYGTTSIYTLLDADGNVFKWFASNDVLEEFVDSKEPVTIQGTIKSHGEWKGIRETHLTRCKVVEKTGDNRMIKAAPKK